MGQSSSAVSTAESDLRVLHSRLTVNLDIIKSLATVSYTDIVKCLEELNAV